MNVAKVARQQFADCRACGRSRRHCISVLTTRWPWVRYRRSMALVQRFAKMDGSA